MNNNNQNNLLVTLADAGFVNQAKQLFSSVYFNAGWEGDYLLICNGIAEEDLAWFKNKGILVYDAPLLDVSRPGPKTYLSIVLSKFYLFKEYFKKWKKIIFLDADIIVRAPLNNLLVLDGFNAPNATTFRLKNEFILDREKNKLIRKKYNLRGHAFCSGFFVFDTGLISKNTFTDILALYHQFRDLYQAGEESPLNLFFYKKWKMLPMVYNSIPWYMEKEYGLNKENLLAVIIHFACANVKPWEKDSAFYQEWSDNLKRAEEINLTARPTAAEALSNGQIYKYLFYLKFRRWAYYINVRYKFINRRVYQFIDRQIGLLGRYIKKKTPGLYERLIKFKKLLF